MRHAQPSLEIAHGYTGVLAEQSSQVALAHVCEGSELGTRPAPRRIPGDGVLAPVHGRVDVVAVREPGSELRVAPAAAHEDGHLARDGLGDLRPAHLLDEEQRQVDSRGDACAREDGAVFDEGAIFLDHRPRCLRAQPADEAVVGRARPAVEAPRAPEQHRAGADARKPCRLGEAAQPGDHPRSGRA